MSSDNAVQKFAHLSPCGLYRYRLDRYWGPGARLPFVMLNPSTADHKIDDPTIRRCMSFARREGAGGITVANLFALRATDPAALRESHVYSFGPGNFDALYELAIWAVNVDMPIVCAWGAGGSIHGGDAIGVEILKQRKPRLVCLGKTKGGSPRHPLYVRGDQPFEAYP